jgi:thiol:disulfide interchange protein
MSQQTFRNDRVRQKMKDFTWMKFSAENPDAETTRAVLREFGVIGLPTFVILTPIK